MPPLDQAILSYIHRYSKIDVVSKILFKLDKIFPNISDELTENLIHNYNTFYSNHDGRPSYEDKIIGSHVICNILIDYIIKKKIKEVKERTGKDLTSKAEKIMGVKIDVVFKYYGSICI